MLNWNSSSCETNGIETHYIRTGGDKPPLILLHGLLAKGSCWTLLARELESEFDVIMPDARGHGNSSAPEYGYSYEDLASDVVGLIKRLELIKPFLVGHSMGGMTAALIASRYSNYLSGIVMADPTFISPQRQQEVYESDLKSEHLRILSKPRDEFYNEMYSRHKKRSQEIIEALAQARFQTSVHAFEILRPPNPDFVHLIKTIEIQSLLITGSLSTVVSLELAIELASFNHCLKISEITNAGHGLHYDQPAKFSNIVKKFLTSLSN